MKAVTGPVSSYSLAELAALPKAKRIRYRILVEPGLTESQAKATLIQFVLDRIQGDPDLDVLVAFAYDRVEDVGNLYTIGRVTWSPRDASGEVPPEVASGNVHEDYAIDLDVKVKPSRSRPSPREFEIHDVLDKELWKDPNVPEETVLRKVAAKLGTDTAEVRRAWTKVTLWKVQ